MKINVPVTRSQHRVALRVASGFTNGQIAEELHIQRKTVEQHLNTLYGNLAAILANRTPRVGLARLVWIGAIPLEWDDPRIKVVSLPIEEGVLSAYR